MMKTTTPPLRLAFLLALLVAALHIATADTLGFHRDEFLYLALGRHLDFGFWSNPPFIGFISWISQHLLGDSIWATRFFPALCAGGLLWIMALMVREFGGGLFAQALSGLSMFGSIAWLRAFSMLQPVPFDIFFWAWLSYLLLKWLKTGEQRWWWYLGIVAGIGFLNKYTIALWALALLLALCVTPRRNVLVSRLPWLAVGIALLIAAPNLMWQWQHHFPIINHLKELSANQLQYVRPMDFMTGQLLMHGIFVLVWLPGLWALLQTKQAATYRVLGWQYLFTLGLLLLLKGKDYYALGAYPVLLSAGAVYWERVCLNKWSRTLLVAVLIGLSAPLLPTGLPILPAPQLVSYFKWLGIEDVVRWEGGKLHSLPQDYADMLGWQQLAALADSAVLRVGDPRICFIYGENYGQAGAVEHLLKHVRPPVVTSFADAYRLWTPDTLAPEIQQFIYINDELGEDVEGLFGDIQKVGMVTDTLAREYGTAVYLCRKPKRDFGAFWAERVKEVKGK